MTLRKFDVEFRKGRRNIVSWMHPVAERWKDIGEIEHGFIRITSLDFDFNFPPSFYTTSSLKNLSIIYLSKSSIKKIINRYIQL